MNAIHVLWCKCCRTFFFFYKLCVFDTHQCRFMPCQFVKLKQIVVRFPSLKDADTSRRRDPSRPGVLVKMTIDPYRHHRLSGKSRSESLKPFLARAMTLISPMVAGGLAERRITNLMDPQAHHSRQLTNCRPSSALMLTQSTSSLPEATPSLLGSSLHLSWRSKTISNSCLKATAFLPTLSSSIFFISARTSMRSSCVVETKPAMNSGNTMNLRSKWLWETISRASRSISSPHRETSWMKVNGDKRRCELYMEV